METKIHCTELLCKHNKSYYCQAAGIALGSNINSSDAGTGSSLECHTFTYDNSMQGTCPFGFGVDDQKEILAWYENMGDDVVGDSRCVRHFMSVGVFLDMYTDSQFNCFHDFLENVQKFINWKTGVKDE